MPNLLIGVGFTTCFVILHGRKIQKLSIKKLRIYSIWGVMGLFLRYVWNLRSQKYRTSVSMWLANGSSSNIIERYLVIRSYYYISVYIDLWQKLNYNSSMYVNVQISETLSIYNSYTVHLYIWCIYWIYFLQVSVLRLV